MNSNLVILREKTFIDDISDKYGYDSNIRHMLYVIIPAFIIKYGVNKEKMILNAFRDIRIVVSNEKSKYVKAFYSSRPKRINGEYKTDKYMVLQNYQETDMVGLLDNLVHEFNHAINSYISEIRETKNYLYLRTGITYRIYKKEDLSFVKKDKSYMLEEIINTKQTEEIINIIKSFDASNELVGNTIYAINSQTNHKYNSNSYYMEGYICKQILENRTFINTLAVLRLNGEVFNVGKWFDEITGEENSYNELTSLLEKIYNQELKYAETKWFKSVILGNIRDTSKNIMRIVDKFNNNVNYR